MTLKCPYCGKEAEDAKKSYRPFCSERCKLLDLGNWLSGDYLIVAQKSNDEEESGQTQSQDNSEKE